MPINTSSTRKPLVSVVMPVYNGERFVAEAIRSILRQTLGNFEFIIVNDGSNDATAGILEAFRQGDDRIAIHHEKLGFAGALNLACEMARGKFIARMDADDLSLPDRLLHQVKFFERCPEIGICGTWFKTLATTRGLVHKLPVAHEQIRCHLLFNSAMLHPSVMIRSDSLHRHGLKYDSQYREASDYSLWVNAANYVRLANLPEVLIYYRIHENQVSRSDCDNQMDYARQIRLEQLNRLNIQPTSNEIDLHQAISTYRFPPSEQFLSGSERWLVKLHDANNASGIYDTTLFSRLLFEKWYSICTRSAYLGTLAYEQFYQSRLSTFNKLDPWRRSKFFVKCLAQARRWPPHETSLGE